MVLDWKSLFGNYCDVCERKTFFKPLPPKYAAQSRQFGFEYFGTGEMTSLETYQCGNCGASDRERLYAHYIRKNLSEKKRIRLFHFAPEKGLRKYIINHYRDIEYSTVDLLANDVDLRLDITDLSVIPENTGDFFICSHVLEHVENDEKAIAELFRITKPGGSGILMAPISTAIQKTIENVPGVNTDADRWKYYGQNDHVRLYARAEYVSRIQNAGFRLSMLDIKYYGARFFRSRGMKNTTVLYIVKK